MSVNFNIEGQRDSVVNFSNVNARQVLDILAVFSKDPRDLYGTIPVSDLDRIIKLAIRTANNTRTDYSTGVEEYSPTPNSARVIFCGTTDDNVRGRLIAMADLAIKAKQAGKPIHYA